MRRVFADTFYFLAVLNQRDSAHEQALAFYGDDQLHLVTTEWILTEVADANAEPARRPGYQQLLAVLEQDKHVQVVPASHELFRRGLRLFFDRPDKAWSLTDCISFVVMSDEGLPEALTGDHHFDQAGFTALLRQKSA